MLIAELTLKTNSSSLKNSLASRERDPSITNTTSYSSDVVHPGLALNDGETVGSAMTETEGVLEKLTELVTLEVIEDATTS